MSEKSKAVALPSEQKQSSINATLVGHVIAEVIVIGGVVYMFTKKYNDLNTRVVALEKQQRESGSESDAAAGITPEIMKRIAKSEGEINNIYEIFGDFDGEFTDIKKQLEICLKQNEQLMKQVAALEKLVKQPRASQVSEREAFQQTQLQPQGQSQGQAAAIPSSISEVGLAGGVAQPEKQVLPQLPIQNENVSEEIQNAMLKAVQKHKKLAAADVKIDTQNPLQKKS